MISPDLAEEFNVQEVEASIIVTHQEACLRLDAVRDLTTSRYSVLAYRQEHVRLQPDLPQLDGKPSRGPEVFEVWVATNDVAWEDADTAYGALARSLARLRDRG